MQLNLFWIYTFCFTIWNIPMKKIIKWWQEKFLKILVYWSPGTGKTRFAWTAKKPLALDVENGLWELNIDRISIDSIDDILTTLNDIIKNWLHKEYDTLIIDSVTALRSNETIKKWKFLRDDRWDLKISWTRLLTRLRKFPMHVICIAHTELQKLEKSNDEWSIYVDAHKYIPQMWGSIKNEINGIFDVVAYFDKSFEDWKNKYIFDVEGKWNNVSKTRYLSSINNDSDLNFSNRVDAINWIEKAKGQEEVVNDMSSTDTLVQTAMDSSWYNDKASADKVYVSLKSWKFTNQQILEAARSKITDDEEYASLVDYVDILSWLIAWQTN